MNQLERAGVRARDLSAVKLTGQDRDLAKSWTYEPVSYFELWVTPWGHVRCTCPVFTYRRVYKNAEALRRRLRGV